MQLASAIAALLLVVPLLVLRLAGRRVDSRAYLATAMPFLRLKGRRRSPSNCETAAS